LQFKVLAQEFRAIFDHPRTALIRAPWRLKRKILPLRGEKMPKNAYLPISTSILAVFEKCDFFIFWWVLTHENLPKSNVSKTAKINVEIRK
jgi:hypothetical protein